MSTGIQVTSNSVSKLVKERSPLAIKWYIVVVLKQTTHGRIQPTRKSQVRRGCSTGKMVTVLPGIAEQHSEYRERLGSPRPRRKKDYSMQLGHQHWESTRQVLLAPWTARIVPRS